MKKSTRKKGNTGKRYSEVERKKIIAFADKLGRGGITAACKKFGVSYIALRRWMKNGTAPAIRGKRGGRAAVAKVDGRKLRRIKTAIASAKLLKLQVGKLQRALKLLAK